MPRCYSWWTRWSWRGQLAWSTSLLSDSCLSHLRGVLRAGSGDEGSPFPLGDNGGVVHLFVVYGDLGAESDPGKLALADQLITCFVKLKFAGTNSLSS